MRTACFPVDTVVMPFSLAGWCSISAHFVPREAERFAMIRVAFSASGPVTAVAAMRVTEFCCFGTIGVGTFTGNISLVNHGESPGRAI